VVADAHDGVVYDLDGTLVRLAVDWDRVHRDLSEALEERGLDV
jgi:phosphoglycolate phosphatase